MDWEAFFVDHGIEYVTRGPNVKRGNVNISCPYCGNDPSHHMGVSLDGKGFGCWRSANHAGKKPHNLIKALLGCSFNQAKLVAEQYSSADPDNLDDALALLQADAPAEKPRDKALTLDFWPEFEPVRKRGSGRRFYQYLEGRGFEGRVDDLVTLYNLQCATSGKFKDRVIIPIYMDGALVSWTSRAIGKSETAPRYLALSETEERGKPGLVNVFHSIWNYDELKHGGDLLVIVEGPIDALKVDFYGAKYNACATCTFGTSMSEEQAYLLAEASRRFKKAVLLYDPEATEAIFRAKELLHHTKVECGFLEDGIEDPGAMTKGQVRRFIKGYLK